MGWCVGGSKLEGKLQELRAALEDYYGGLNELKEGLRQTVPEPPEALVYWRQCRALGIPLVAGGLLEQPHIWLLELAIVKEVEDTFEIANALAQEQEQNNAPRPEQSG